VDTSENISHHPEHQKKLRRHCPAESPPTDGPILQEPLRGSSIIGFAFRIRHGRIDRFKDSLGHRSFLPLDSVAMGTKPKNSRQNLGGKSPGTGGRVKAANRRTRPHSILLANLFLCIRIVDECLYHPIGALSRAAKTEGYTFHPPLFSSKRGATPCSRSQVDASR
jgi:hypothetical protein